MTDRFDLLPGRNALLEALRAGRHFHEILVDDRARPDEKLGQITALCGQAGVPVRRVGRRELDRLCPHLPHQGVVGKAAARPEPRLHEVMESCLAGDADACFLLLRRVSFEHNLGAILRTADAAGVTAVVIPSRQGAGPGSNVARVSMGATEHVPVIRHSLTAAAADLRRAGFRLVAAEAGRGKPAWECDLTGPLAIILGGEHDGVSDPLLSRCHDVVHIPQHGHVGSLNVSVATGILLYERLRQTGRGR